MTLPMELPSATSRDRLRFDATVSRALVHRASVAEVFITDSVAAATNGIGRRDAAFEVAAQLPRGHLIGEHAPAYDFLLIVEVLRQAGVFVAHQHLDVELDTAFIFKTLSYRVISLEAMRIGPRPGEAVISMEVNADRNRAGRVLGFEFTGTLSIDGVPALEGSGALTFVSKRAFGMLRAKGRERVETATPGSALVSRLARSAPATLGRRDPRNVVITEPTVAPSGAALARLVVDTGHPHLFDHKLDHVPGNLQLEGARQIAVAAVARLHGLYPEQLVITALKGDFTEFAELDLSTSVHAQVDGVRHAKDLGMLSVPVEVRMEQSGSVVSRVTVEVAQWA
ncbi:AfsA-related hotdog domain-containing protein [Streptomyces sp. DSM 44917]|uniref:AfsA-related hotdog domain-containing protein n=1 Tax=Streptomyces boetiae TaxID=3075541 RepID=A0ABU2L716_9ACTN|nr:AfsA-related hotdog domain-containing protein [Streptomyces sp. DSM 44917]MDT0307368.1 AfsA-related hotdog domain-containing protein [Streptomyces sp. DSM 44917]